MAVAETTREVEVDAIGVVGTVKDPADDGVAVRVVDAVWVVDAVVDVVVEVEPDMLSNEPMGTESIKPDDLFMTPGVVCMFPNAPGTKSRTNTPPKHGDTLTWNSNWKAAVGAR